MDIHRTRQRFVLGLFAAQLIVWSCAAGVRVDQLRSEYRENPLGIDAAAPRLSWQLESDGRGQRQTAYRVLVATEPELLNQDQADLWDSGRVVSEQTFLIPYAGKPLASRQAAHWKVRVWDKDGNESGWSPVASWEMGLLDLGDWTAAQWIRLAEDNRNSPLTKRAYQTDNMKEPRMVEAEASPLMRREFEVKRGIQRARAYVCGLGYHELSLNGRRCGDAVLEPGQTTYDVHAYYVTHDITKLVRLPSRGMTVPRLFTSRATHSARETV